MIAATNLANRQSLLVQMNVTWLRQAQQLVEQISDSAYTASPQTIAPHRVGSHLRHILEFYECFLDGLKSSHVDYDARKRDLAVERNRYAALAKIRSIIDALETEPLMRSDSVVWVRMEDSDGLHVGEPFLTSSIGRELQTLSSHSVHHFALIAMTLRVLGYEVDRDFGMAPSTLRYLASKRRAEAA